MNKNIKDYIKNNILITDGAMGTYYSAVKTTDTKLCENASLTEPDTILKIHKEYIKAGAKLIKTNTFSANSMNFDRPDVEKIIERSVEIARKAAEGNDVFIGASIGPIFSEKETLAEYELIIDKFISLGIDIFVFETHASLEDVLPAAAYIKSKNKDAFVMVHFAVSDLGSTKLALTAEKIANELIDNENIDIFGFNCGVGPVHMMNIIKKLNISKAFSVLPNAGYPEILNGKTVYPVKPQYFADVLKGAAELGAKVLGGCCGTTPEHIKALSESLKKISGIAKESGGGRHIESSENLEIKKNKFNEKLDKGEFVVAVEMMSPMGTDISKLIEGVEALSKVGVDIYTIADCPMGKARAESTVIAAKIMRETNSAVMPHLCCRDRNTTALKASVLGGYIEGIRNILAVTGDPAVGDVKPVFNLNSYSLINMINEMNENEFSKDRIYIGAAVNLNVKNKPAEYKRLLKKAENGGKYFLTQPIFTDETIDFIKEIGKNKSFKILGGIMPPVSYKNVRFINNELPGIDIPEKYASRFSPDMSREEAQETGIEIAVEIAKRLYPYVDGFYINTPFNRYEMVAEILKRVLGAKLQRI